MNAADLHEHLQRVYFDNVDRADAAAAVQAFTEDVRWQHTQVWPHHGHSARSTDALEGRKALFDFLDERVVQTQEVGIQHKVLETLANDRMGAFRGCVVGPDGRTRGFLGWVELSGGLISRYVVAPESVSG